MIANRRVLREEPRFRRLLLAGLISGLGDWFNTVAVLGLLLALTGSGLAVGLTIALRVFPRLIVGPLAGVLADRFPRKPILVAADLASAALALAFLLATAPARAWVVYAATVALVVVSLLRAPTRAAVVPSLVRPTNLLAANALQGAVDGSVMVAGAVLGGVAAGAFGPRVAFILNAASFAASALLTLSIRFPKMTAGARRGMAALWDVYPVVRTSRLLRLLLLLGVLWPIGGGIVNVLITVYGARVFAAGDLGIGVLYGAIGVGTLLGGLLTPLVAGRPGWMRVALGLAFVVEGAGHALVSRAPDLASAAALLLAATAGAGVGNACVSYLLQRATPPPFLGRVSALMSTLSGVTFGLSLVGTGALLGALPARTLGLLAGLLIAGAGLAAGLGLARIPLPEPAPTPEPIRA